MKSTWRRFNSVHHPNQASSKLKLKLNDDLNNFPFGITSNFNTNLSFLLQILKANTPNFLDGPTTKQKNNLELLLIFIYQSRKIYSIIIETISNYKQLVKVLHYIKNRGSRSSILKCNQ